MCCAAPGVQSAAKTVVKEDLVDDSLYSFSKRFSGTHQGCLPACPMCATAAHPLAQHAESAAALEELGALFGFLDALGALGPIVFDLRCVLQLPGWDTDASPALDYRPILHDPPTNPSSPYQPLSPPASACCLISLPGIDLPWALWCVSPIVQWCTATPSPHSPTAAPPPAASLAAWTTTLVSSTRLYSRAPTWDPSQQVEGKGPTPAVPTPAAILCPAEVARLLGAACGACCRCQLCAPLYARHTSGAR